MLTALGGLPLALLTPFPAAGQQQQTSAMNAMDHGPFVTTTITLDPLTERAILAHKAIVIKVADDAAMAFDTDLLRVVGGWKGGLLHWYPARDGLQEWPTPDGFLHFTNDATPGWTTGRNFADIRPYPFGPLPDDRRYRGLNVHGDTVVLSYTVAGSEVLEMFGYDEQSGAPIFTRTLNLTPTSEELALHIVRAPEGRSTSLQRTMLGPSRGVVQLTSGGRSRTIGFDGLTEEATWRLQGAHLVLSLGAVQQPLSFRISVGPVVGDTDTEYMARHLNTTPWAQDLRVFQQPGPADTRVVTTHLELGTEEGPFVVDELVLPVQNPWQSHIRLSAVDFLSDGRAAVASMSGDIWFVDGIDSPNGTLEWKRFATGLFQPLGMRVIDDVVYVAGRDQITRLLDLNGDDHADVYESFNNEVMAEDNFHGFLMNLETDPQGNFYFGKGTPDPYMLRGVVRPLTPYNGTILRVSADGSEMEVVATGARNPNGMSIGPNGEIYFADQQGTFVPTSTIHRVGQNTFHGYMASAHGIETLTDEVFEKPIAWIPNHMDNSPGQPKVIVNPSWPQELQNDLVLVSYGRGTMAFVLLEEVNGKQQGAHIVLPLEFNSGLQHTRFRSDGHLYIVGLTNWASRGHGGEVGSFHRVRYTGEPLRLPVDVRTWANGLELRFREPLDPASAADPSNYGLTKWTYAWSSLYGTPRGLYSVDRPGEIGEDTVQVRAVTLSDDHRSVFLEIPGLEPGPVNVRVPLLEDHPEQIEAAMGIVVAVEYSIRAVDGGAIENLLHKTIHNVPEEPFDPGGYDSEARP